MSSKLLQGVGVKHGWFLRAGGASEGLFTSLNGKKGSGDLDENVDENRRRAVEALVRSGENTAQLAHIIHQFKDGILSATKRGEFSNYDASLTTVPNLLLSQTTADCGSVVIGDQAGRVVGLVHVSWHTTRLEIICKLVAEIKKHTVSGLVAGIGPMICRDCYEFGPEAADLFSVHYLKPIGKKYRVDLKAMIIEQLKRSGVSQIDDLNICTLEDERFFSHRRSGPRSGRMITLAGLTDVV